MEREGFKEKREDDTLPFFFNRRKDLEQKAAAHWQRIACRLEDGAKSGTGEATAQNLVMLKNNDPDHE